MRCPRLDTPGSLHHITNRAIGRRPFFETEGDISAFLGRIARSIEKGNLIVVAYSVLTTHFHLVGGSPDRTLSAGMRDAQSGYVRPFNEQLGREGSLVCGPFFSRRIDTDRYFRNVVRYVDLNAVEAGLVVRPGDYPFGSAHWYESGRGPSWLTRGPIEKLAMRLTGARAFDVGVYRRCFGKPLSSAEREAQDLGLMRGNAGWLSQNGPLAGAAPSVQAEMQARALRADGMRVGTPLIDRDTIAALIAGARAETGAWQLRRGQRETCGWRLVELAFDHDLCGEAQDAIALRLGSTRAKVRRALEIYRALLTDPNFARRVRWLLDRLPPDVQRGVPI